MLPATQPSEADTNVTAAGANPAGIPADVDPVVAGGVVLALVGAGPLTPVTPVTPVTVEAEARVAGGPALVAGLGETIPILFRDDPPPGQLTTARLTPAATAAATTARGQRARALGRGAGTG
jgi:hypothetical protein